jgi:hypothetical protein
VVLSPHASDVKKNCGKVFLINPDKQNNLFPHHPCKSSRL